MHASSSMRTLKTKTPRVHLLENHLFSDNPVCECLAQSTCDGRPCFAFAFEKPQRLPVPVKVGLQQGSSTPTSRSLELPQSGAACVLHRHPATGDSGTCPKSYSFICKTLSCQPGDRDSSPCRRRLRPLTKWGFRRLRRKTRFRRTRKSSFGDGGVRLFFSTATCVAGCI